MFGCKQRTADPSARAIRLGALLALSPHLLHPGVDNLKHDVDQRKHVRIDPLGQRNRRMRRSRGPAFDRGERRPTQIIGHGRSRVRLGVVISVRARDHAQAERLRADEELDNRKLAARHRRFDSAFNSATADDALDRTDAAEQARPALAGRMLQVRAQHLRERRAPRGQFLRQAIEGALRDHARGEDFGGYRL